MSGRRQHFLPRFLQRGFTSNSGSGRTWLYWQDQEPREVGIRDVGVEGDFYSEAGNATVDDAITDAESNEFSVIVRRARASGAGSFHDPVLPRLLAHLEVRSRNLRQGALAVSDRVFTGVLERIEQPDVLERILNRRMERNHSTILGQIRIELRAKGLPQSKANEMLRLMKKAVPGVVQSSQVNELRAQFRLLLPRLLKEGAKRGQISALQRSIAPEVRTEVYERLHFTIEEIVGDDMILGDSGVLFLVEHANAFKPFVDKDDNVMAAFLPVSSSRLLIGAKQKGLAFDPREVRRHVASCSFDFFISAEQSAANREIQANIRTEALPLSDETIDQMIAEIIDAELD